VKALAASLLLSALALAQTPASPKVVTFNRADTVHCKVISVDGKPLLETTFGGTSVAVGVPENNGNGEFSVYVSIAQGASATGTAEVLPKHFSALFSDPAHTRFAYFDKAHDLDTQESIRAAGLAAPGASSAGGGASASSANANSSFSDPDPTHPEVVAMGAVRETNPGTRSEEEARQLQHRSQTGRSAEPAHVGSTRPHAFLRQSTVKQGSHVAGFVYFRKPKSFKSEIAPTDTLDEIDIPINGMIFRF
jgi:hypothetical protein